MSTEPIQPEINQGFPIQIHPFYNWKTVSSLIGEDIIANILRVDDQTDVEHLIIEENNTPRVIQKLFEDVFKLNKECFDSCSIEPYNEALDVVNIMDHNKEMLNRPELLSIERVHDFSKAYPYLFNHLVNYFDING